jgi:hypothetical protein
VTVLPTVCRIEARIDFAASGLGNPENSEYARKQTAGGYEIDYDSLYAKLNMLDTNVTALTEAGLEYLSSYQYQKPKQRTAPKEQARLVGVYTSILSEYIAVTDSVVTCWFETESMYFDAPENLTLRFAGYDGKVIDIPIALRKSP